MAQQTNTALRQQVIYSIFVRNFTPEGTFKAIIPQLDAIQALGTDTIWLLPIHPLGEVNRKGVDGSPYAIKDYRGINPEYGTLEDFKALCDAIHQKGMKIMIDVVYNHTSPDSVLVNEHPEWFFRKPDGKMGNQVGEWTDIVDLDYKNRELWDYQIETLKQWAALVDGFRCDVAPFVPVDFWKEAREAVAQVNPDMIWLSESVHLAFIREMRALGVLAHSDSEIYQAFDMTYDYDVRDAFDAYIEGAKPLSYYIDRLNLQDVIYPANYVKLRNLENHDNVRIKKLVDNEERLLQWTAFSFLQKGATLIYNGQEVQASHTPSLFDKDTIDWQSERSLADDIQRFAHVKKTYVPQEDAYTLTAFDELDAVVIRYNNSTESFIGICSFKQAEGFVDVPVQDGEYTNLLTDEPVHVTNGQVALGKTAIAFSAPNR
ncbi:MAG: alpha-amylase family glycosyl hydrolase [Aerococcaceae bacterium]|nr:alpha-amylase family glycosyl hydrolase [Aerococcaceae bacterium]